MDVLLAACHVDRGAIGGVEEVLTRGIEAIRARYGAETDRDDAGLRALARIYDAQNRSSEARALRRSLDSPASERGES